MQHTPTAERRCRRVGAKLFGDDCVTGKGANERVATLIGLMDLIDRFLGLAGKAAVDKPDMD